MTSAICYECIEDEYLKELVLEGKEILRCSVCECEENPVITVTQLGELLDPIMREHFSIGELTKVFDGDDDNGSWQQEGEYLTDILQEVLGQYYEFDSEIVQAMVEAEGCCPHDGDVSFYDDTSCYVPTKVQIQHYYAEWDNLLESLLYKSKFFNGFAKDFFDRIFSDVDQMVSWEAGNGRVSVVRELPAGTEIYRARNLSNGSSFSELASDPMKNIGPPPAKQARAGRMNAEGVVVLYGAMDEATCLAEIRPAIGGMSALIKLATTVPLRLLDFSLLSSAYKGTPLSYFQPDFTEEVERRKFIRKLHGLISQPITPGNESKYIITQTMAEYLANVHTASFDGILFSSVQNENGLNIVLFPSRDVLADMASNVFPVKYVASSLKAFSTNAITYRHSEKRTYTNSGVTNILGDSEEFGF